MLFFEGFLLILITGYLAQQGAATTNDDDRFAYALSIIFVIIIFTLVPAVHIFILCKSESGHQSQEFAIKYGEIYPKLNMKLFTSLFYQMLFLVRRFVFVCIMFSHFMKKYLLL
jgi:hypothetical protein